MYKLKRLLFVLFALCLLTGIAGASLVETMDTALSGGAPLGGPLTLALETIAVDPGESFELAGTVTYASSDLPVVGVSIILQRQASAGGWTTVDDATTDARGDYSFTRTEPVSGVYRYHTLVDGQLINEGWIVTVGSGAVPVRTTVRTSAPTTVPTTVPTMVPTTASTSTPTTVPTTVTPTTVVIVPFMVATPIPTIEVTQAPAITPSPMSPRFGLRRYVVGAVPLNPPVGVSVGSPRAISRPSSNPLIGTSVATGLHPPAARFVRWYPAARWRAGSSAGNQVLPDSISTVPSIAPIATVPMVYTPAPIYTIQTMPNIYTPAPIYTVPTVPKIYTPAPIYTIPSVPKIYTPSPIYTIQTMPKIYTPAPIYTIPTVPKIYTPAPVYTIPTVPKIYTPAPIYTPPPIFTPPMIRI